MWFFKPYFSNELNTGQEYYRQMYDEVVVPMELADVRYKAAIGRRNRWMTAIKYAEKQRKPHCLIKAVGSNLA